MKNLVKASPNSKQVFYVKDDNKVLEDTTMDHYYYKEVLTKLRKIIRKKNYKEMVSEMFLLTQNFL